MSKWGTPIYKPADPSARVSVCVELPDGTVFYRTWKGRSIRGIHRTARLVYAEKYPGARISFGHGIYVYD